MVIVENNQNLGDLNALRSMRQDIINAKTLARNVYCDFYDDVKCASFFYFNGNLDIGNSNDFMTDIVNIESNDSDSLQYGEIVRCHLINNNGKPIIKYGIVEKHNSSVGGIINEL